ncbi:uncharacterized protein L203_103125 [Cryptococcus depauperatus CBS 7841]|uniref:Uncharacterized protein n=1 Tax=Cryptococcus depauperatus CBS 7841 TaxID=1295531 RepID=A0A1E3IPI2_9TREE|nr:hypothetical protein L203_01601 [Cryptococcus depauperatus CBS 7841]
MSDDEEFTTGIPEAYLGHSIEDLAYGAGSFDTNMQFWDDETDEEEEMFINQLSGSEVDRQSLSSVYLEDSEGSTSESEESTDETLDEFGFPIPFAACSFKEGIDEDNPGLILMENWDGQFVLVQPRAERSRSRHRADRGSHTAESVSGSVASGTEHPLIIDAGAERHESSSDGSYWSGMSDEDDLGDTTDSMAEEDMPVLDSPALNEIMDHQIAEAVYKMAVDADVNGMILPEAVTGPSIVVTDTADVTTPALSTTSSTNPMASISTLPATPLIEHPHLMPSASTSISIPLAPNIPVMGTFLPTTDDPAQCAVIDGSGSTTKSPFTHRRRSRRNRDVASLASYREEKESKRKPSHDLFSPSQSPSVSCQPQISARSKRLRYSSIPGHPRYIAARRAAEALADEGENTDSEEEAFNLEDMLEEGVLVDNNSENQDDQAPHLRHMLRFDRVGVSTYLRRNFGTLSQSQLDAGGFQSQSLSPGTGRLDHTLAGPMGGRMLVSPVLNAVEERQMREGKGGREGRKGRKERKDRRKRRKERGGRAVVPELRI